MVVEVCRAVVQMAMVLAVGKLVQVEVWVVLEVEAWVEVWHQTFSVQFKLLGLVLLMFLMKAESG